MSDESRAVLLPGDPVVGAPTHIEDHQRIKAALAELDGRPTQAQSDARYVQLAKDAQRIQASKVSIDGTNFAEVELNAPAGKITSVTGRRGGVSRWLLGLGYTQAETGNNAGTDFVLMRYSDAGAFLATPLTIRRDTGLLTVGATTAPGGSAAQGVAVPVADTGWREVRTLVSTADGWDDTVGTVRIRRTGNVVFVGFLSGVRRAVDGPAGLSYILRWANIGVGFGCTATIVHNLAAGGTPSATNAHSNGTGFAFNNAKAGNQFDCFGSWPTNDPWPTVLPGTRAADEGDTAGGDG